MAESRGRFGIHGGQYIPETLMNAVIELEEAYNHYKNDPQFQAELTELFYEFKNATRDALSDDELLRAMAALFDGPAQGSVERLSDAGTALLLRAAGGEPCASMDDDEGSDDPEEDGEDGDDGEAW